MTILSDTIAVDLNPDTMEKFAQEMDYLDYPEWRENKETFFGSFLVVTPCGPRIISAITFHLHWRFVFPEHADRTQLRTIVRR